MRIPRTATAMKITLLKDVFLALLLVTAFGGAEAQAGGYGTRETVGSGSDEITLVKVGGTRYQMGYWYGRLLAEEIAGCWSSLSAAVPFIEQQYDDAIAAMWNPAYFDTAAYEAELQGIADGCEDGGHPEITLEELQKMHVLPDMSEFHCSLFAAWGDATADGHLYQLRNLDWSMDTGIQDYPVVAVFEPVDGHVHAVIGFAGLIGVAGGGISENGIAQSEIMGYFCDPETLNGIPFPFLLRDILYHDTTLAEALSRIQNATRTNNYHYGLSGPDGAEITGRLLLTSNTRCDIYADGASVDPHPCFDDEGLAPFHDPLADVVYWTRHNGSRNEEFYNAISARYGSIDSTRSMEIADIIQDSGGGTLLSVVYDSTAREFWVAYAEGTNPAPEQGYVHFDLTIPEGLTALDSYVAAPDDSYTWTQVGTINGSGYTAYVLDMTSQTWLTAAEVNRTQWQHWVTVIKPDTVSSTMAFLNISSGNNGGSPPTSVDSTLAAIATTTNTVVAQVRMVPNQPLTFTGDVPRREDALIAYNWDKFLTTGEEIWVTRLPMTKAAVRAMDAVEEFCASPAGGSLTIDRFVVAGASKRGWTTWTTAAVDARVVAIAPIVIDLLDVEVSFNHHWAALGFWAEAVHDYEDMGIMDWFGTPELQSLWEITDPYSYRTRYSMPKYIINSSGDDFFLPDSSQFYFDDLPDEKYLRYVPNTDHGLGDSDAWNCLLAFYQSVVDGGSRPQFSWTLESDDSIRVQTNPLDPPSAVNLWQATNPSARDFRKNPYPPRHPAPTPVWYSSPLSDQGGGVYVAEVDEPPAGWTAFFVELVYDSGGTNPYKFTTEINVVPYNLPFACDFDRDSDIDLMDLGVFAGQWLETGKLSADVTPKGGDGTVNSLDFADFVNSWLRGVE
jgi:PhoPQ-activated pathogenicity-related protein